VLPEFRGLLHRLTEALGLLVDDEGDMLPPGARAALKAIGVKAGRFGLFVPALLKPRAAAMRARLWGVHRGVRVPELPPPDVVSVPRRPDWPAGFADAMGWLEAGPVLLRLDIAERIAAELAWATRRAATAMPAGLASRFSLKADLLPVVLRRLGFRSVPAEVLAADAYGPPAPAMLLPLRRRRPVASEASPVHAHGPFAALAALKR
jgi:ATP-dependent RNA helicase SUPV3L1/SUV3